MPPRFTPAESAEPVSDCYHLLLSGISGDRVVEMMAERMGSRPAAWTSAVPAAPERLFLVQAAEVLPRLRRLCEEEGPEPLRRRGLLAPPGFLTAG